MALPSEYPRGLKPAAHCFPFPIPAHRDDSVLAGQLPALHSLPLPHGRGSACYRIDTYRARGTGLVRTLVVATATLAILLVCFAIYQSTQIREQEQIAEHRPRLPSPASIPSADQTGSSPREPKPAVEVGGAKVGEGKGVTLNLYPREGKRARVQILGETWAPVEGSPDEILLSQPEVRLRTNEGNAIRVRAKQCHLETHRRPGGQLEPRRGQLSGDVIIEMDRLTEHQRSQLPGDRKNTPAPEELVVLETDEISFDLEFAKIVVPEKIRLRARDVEFSAVGVEIQFNEIENRVETFRVRQGGRIELKETDRGLALGMPESDPTPAKKIILVDWLRDTLQQRLAEQAAKQTEVRRQSALAAMNGRSSNLQTHDLESNRAEPNSAKSSNAAAAGVDEKSRSAIDKNTPVFHAHETKVDASKKPIRYFARFSRAVQARQMVGDRIQSRLEADMLDVLRELSDEDQSRVRQEPETTAAKTTAAKFQKGEENQKPQERVVLTWDGPLLVEALGDDDPRWDGPYTALVTAQGEPARLFSPDGEAEFAKLRFQPQEPLVIFYGSRTQPATVRSTAQGRVSGSELFMQRDGDQLLLQVVGPGELVQGEAWESLIPLGSQSVPGATNANGVNGEPSSGKPLHIAFTERLDVRGRFVTQRRFDLSGTITIDEQRVMDRAVLVGGVHIQQDETSMETGELTVFFEPGLNYRNGNGGQSIERLEARKGVTIRRGTNWMTGQEMDVNMTTDHQGQAIPLSTTIRGDVEAREGERTIKASDELTLEFEFVSRPPPPFNPLTAHQEVVDAGMDPSTVDWQVEKSKHESSRRSEIGVKQLTAVGTVDISDPKQAVELSCDKVVCTLTNGSEIKAASVWGSDDRPASVRLADSSIIGDEIKLNVPDEWVEVPGAGRMSFRSRKDLDGRKLDEPIPIAVTWSEWMKFHGRENRSVFSGNVHATSETTTTFDCDRLIVEFEEVADTRTARGEKLNWWIFQGLVDRIQTADEERHRSENQPRFSRQPVYLLATGRVVATTAEVHQNDGTIQTRASIRGPKLSLNLREEISKMLLEGAGSLLLEDIRPAKPKVRTVANGQGASRKGLFDVEQESGPSITLIEWQRSMWYDFSIEQTRFEGSVQLKHFSGREVLQIMDLPAVLNSMPKGRRTFLISDLLTVDFGNAIDGYPTRKDSRRMGGLSASRLSQFQARGNVTLEDIALHLFLSANQVIYERDRDLLAVYGSSREKARIVFQPPGEFPQDYSAIRCFVNLDTGALEGAAPTGTQR